MSPGSRIDDARPTILIQSNIEWPRHETYGQRPRALRTQKNKMLDCRRDFERQLAFKTLQKSEVTQTS